MFPNVHTIDWTFINKLDLDELRNEEDKDTFKSVIRNFLDSNSLFSNPSYSPPELVFKFFQVLQLSVKYLVSENNSLKKYIHYQHEKIINLSNKIRESKDVISEKQKVIDNYTPEYKLVYQCPFCSKQFSSHEFFQYHYNRNHKAQIENHNIDERKDLLNTYNDDNKTKLIDKRNLRKHINVIMDDMDQNIREKNKEMFSRRLVELERKYEDKREEKRKRKKQMKPTKTNPFEKTF